MSGFDFSGWGGTIAGVSVKEYAMHWAMMLRFYGDEILAANAGLDEKLLVRALVRVLGIADDDGLPHLSDYHYPDPNEAHPCGTRRSPARFSRRKRKPETRPSSPSLTVTGLRKISAADSPPRIRQERMDSG